MPLSFQQHTANGSTTVFDASQIDGYLSLSHLYVYVNDVQKTVGVHYSIQTSPALQITFLPGNTPAFKDEVRIQRITPNTVADREVDFADGSVLNANDLDKSALQLLYITQEAEDTGSGALGKSFDQLSWNAETHPITNSAMGTDPSSLTTKGYVDSLALYGGAVTVPQAWTFSGDGVQDTFTLSPVATSTDPAMFIVEVGGTILRPTTDYTIPTTSQIVFAGGAIPALGTSNVRVRNLGVARNINESVSTAMLQNDAVTTAKILNANVTAAKLATDSVETAKIVNLAVTTGKINDLAVTTGKINDLAVTTGKINDLAVTTGKLDNLAVTAGKIAAGAVTSSKLDTNISVAGTLGVTGAFTASGGLGGSLIQSATAVASGTVQEFTGIPSWARRVTIAFNAISTTGSSVLVVRIGSSGGLQTTNYAAYADTLGLANSGLYTTGFPLGGLTTLGNTEICHGLFTLIKIGNGNDWVGHGLLTKPSGTPRLLMSAGRAFNGGVLDRVAITTHLGTDTFDSGSFTVTWE